MYHEIIPLLSSPFDQLKAILALQFDTAYGKRYTVNDLRKAVQDRQFSIIPYKSENTVVVGENPETLLLSNGKEIFELDDESVSRGWNGETVIVIEPKKGIARQDNKLVLFTPERDDWRDIEARDKALPYLEAIEMGEVWLPECPVVVTFKQPGQKERDEKIRADLVGVEITLYDTTDPVTQFFHELGHIFWRDRMNDSERQGFRLYQETMTRETVSPVFTDRWGFSDGEEAFATIYLWYCKGKLLSTGYMKILQYHEQKGYDMLMAIFDRIEQERFAQDEWRSQAGELAVYMEKASPMIVKIQGRGVVKARVVSDIRRPRITVLPDFVKATDVIIDRGVRYVSVDQSSLMGKLIPVNDKNEIIYAKVGHEKLIKAGRRNIAKLTKKTITNKKGHRQTVYVRTGKPEKDEPSTHTIRITNHNGQTSLKSFSNEKDAREWAHGRIERAAQERGKGGTTATIEIIDQGKDTRDDTWSTTLWDVQEPPQEGGVLTKEVTINSPSFLSWFGDWRKGEGSRVINKVGEPAENYHMTHTEGAAGPVRVYHGTASGGFDRFDKEKADKDGLFGPGFYFTEDKSIAQEYQDKGFGGSKTGNIKKFDTYTEANDFVLLMAAKSPIGKHWVSSKTADGYIAEEYNQSESDRMIYEVFLNIRNPFNADNQNISSSMLPKDIGKRYADYLRIFRQGEIGDVHAKIKKYKFELENFESGNISFVGSEDDLKYAIEMRKVLLNKFQKDLDLINGNIKQFEDGTASELKNDMPYNKAVSMLFKAYFQYNAVQGQGSGLAKKMLNELLVKNGYDGITHTGGAITGGKPHRVWIAFEPDQIKATTAKNFDPADPDIFKAIKEKTNKVVNWSIATFDRLRKQIETKPTEAQKESGNYKKASLPWNGLKITIENPKGSTRSGVSKDGKEWKSKLFYDYGYINNTEGKDGDHVDVFLHDDQKSDMVYVIDQVDPKTGKFDEHKVMIGFPDKESAEAGYLKNYEPGWKGIGETVPMTVEQFKEWLDKRGNTKKPSGSLVKAIKALLKR